MEGIHNKVVGAITSNMWSDFDKAGSSDDQLKLMIFDMEVRNSHLINLQVVKHLKQRISHFIEGG